MTVLACSPKYMPKLPAEEKKRQEDLRKALRPGLVLEYIKSDYHEDDETPPGFHEVGDRLELVRVVDVRPVVDSKTREKVSSYNVWLCKSSHWGEKKQDEHYLAAMTKLAGG